MNANLLNVVKDIVEKNGETVLSEPRRVSSFLADLAREEPKPQKNALVKSLEHGFAQTLKNVPAADRDCCNWYGDYSSGAQTDPTGASSGSHRVGRGGLWDASAEYVRSAGRSDNNPDYRHYGIGFRLVRP